MIKEVFETIIYFLHLSVRTELLWIILPLAIATVVMLFYQEKYKNECPGWNSYVSNSLVLLFVAVILFRTVYGIDHGGAINFVNYGLKTIVSSIVLLIGILLLFLNFEHYLPEKIARSVSSPLTVNLLAYMMILCVYSDIPLNGVGGTALILNTLPVSGYGINALALLILFVLLLAVLNLIKIPIEKFFKKMQKMKDRERVDNFKAEERKIEQQKKEIRKYERKLKKVTLEEAKKRKKEAKKLRKIVKKRK